MVATGFTLSLILLLQEVLQLALQNLRSGTTQVSAHPLTEFVFGTLPPETGRFFGFLLERCENMLLAGGIHGLQEVCWLK